MAGRGQAGSSGAWAERYTRLLESVGLSPESVLTQAIQPSSNERSGLFSLAQCLENPALLIDQMHTDY
ncbi:MAG: hypothetical protein ACQETT_14645, partial [Pseudomonadota bacterium]